MAHFFIHNVNNLTTEESFDYPKLRYFNEYNI